MRRKKQTELRLCRGTRGGWRPGAGRKPGPNGPPPVAEARTWLARKGWRRFGLLDPAEV